MDEPANNRSNNVFKRFFRSTRVRGDGESTIDAQKKKPLTHLPQINATTRKIYLKNIETGEPDAQTGRCGPFRWFVVWDSNFSLKLLGSKNAIEKEEERRLSLPYFIIHPCCRFK